MLISSRLLQKLGFYSLQDFERLARWGSFSMADDSWVCAI